MNRILSESEFKESKIRRLFEFWETYPVHPQILAILIQTILTIHHVNTNFVPEV